MEKELKIDLISDTHGQHDKLDLQGGDILIHAGDMSMMGKIKEIAPFLEWFNAQKYTHLVLIPGNHDWGFEQAFGVFADECKRLGIHLLNDSGIEIEGIKIWGSPVQPWFGDWAFNRERGQEIKKHWDLIPEDTEVLVTHGPPYGILDTTRYRMSEENHVGCKELMNKIMNSNIKLHVFGHIHEGRGHKYKDGKVFVNASSLDERYRMVTNKPVTVIKTFDESYLID